MDFHLLNVLEYIDIDILNTKIKEFENDNFVSLLNLDSRKFIKILNKLSTGTKIIILNKIPYKIIKKYSDILKILKNINSNNSIILKDSKKNILFKNNIITL